MEHAQVEHAETMPGTPWPCVDVFVFLMSRRPHSRGSVQITGADPESILVQRGLDLISVTLKDIRVFGFRFQVLLADDAFPA